MPMIAGGAEKSNKRGRLQHHSHTFAGIHSLDMRSKGVDIDASVTRNTLNVTLTNKMPHPLIIQAARLKYLDITILRDKKVIFKNFQHSPTEDKQGAFHIEFLDENNNEVIIPSLAKKRGFVNNLMAKETKTLHYTTPQLHNGDTIIISLYVILAKPNCSKVINLKDPNLKKAQLMKKYTLKVNNL
jgi:hypothetical protein